MQNLQKMHQEKNISLVLLDKRYLIRIKEEKQGCRIQKALGQF